jgi:hypothetical protein
VIGEHFFLGLEKCSHLLEGFLFDHTKKTNTHTGSFSLS